MYLMAYWTLAVYTLLCRPLLLSQQALPGLDFLTQIHVFFYKVVGYYLNSFGI